MGLLTAAEKKNTEDDPQFPPDEKAISLRDRILRIPSGSNTAYTALSLLKAYGSFKSGVCLTLENDRYTGYSSVGMGFGKTDVSSDAVFKPEKKEADYFQYNDEEKTALGFMDADMDIWCFPLDSAVPWEAAAILGVTEKTVFDPQKIFTILESIHQKIYPQNKIALEIEPEPEESAEPDIIIEPILDDFKDHSGLQLILEQYWQMNESLDGLVLAIPAGIAEDQPESVNKIKSMVSHFANVETLSREYCLLLFQGIYDRELIAHRLRNSLKTETPLVFSCTDPVEALRKIQPYC